MPRQNSLNWSAADQISATRLNDLNEDLDDVYATWTDRLKVWHVTGLQIQIGAWSYRVWSVEWIYAWWFETLDDDTISYISLTGGWLIDVSTVGWDANFLRLAKVTTVWGTVTTVQLWRPDGVGGILGGGWFKEITSCVYTEWFLTSFDWDGVTYTLTYTTSGSLETITNGVNVWTITYDSLWNLSWLSEA